MAPRNSSADRYSALKMMKNYILTTLIILIFVACKGQDNSKLSENSSNPEQIKEEQIVKDVALSFHQWNIECIKNRPESVSYDFYIIKTKNGNCELDSSGYFNSLRKLGTISEKFIKHEWSRVSKCSDFLKTLKWSQYSNSDAYEYQDYCDIYYHYWTRTQEPFDGVEVRDIEKKDEAYLVTLVFYYEYDSKDYSDNYLPLVTVEKENDHWKITEIKWLEGQ